MNEKDDPLLLPGAERPSPRLLLYYAVASLAWGPLFPFRLVRNFFRYETLRYRFDERGVQMSWGVLFRREISLQYARIQDIHLASNLLERWLGLARIQVQTAAGSAAAEMTLEGLTSYEEVRDFLYRRMRGFDEETAEGEVSEGGSEPAVERIARALEATAAELAALRVELARQRDESPRREEP